MAKQPAAWTMEATSKNVHTITFPNVAARWEQWLLLRGDAHHDNAKSDNEFEYKHLKEAVKRKAIVIDVGDVFDAMQGKDDRRQSKDELKEKHKRTNYFDTLINTAIEDYTPYAKQFALIGLGNHETAVLDHHGINLIDHLCKGLRAAGSQVQAGCYGGWIRFHFIINKTGRQSLNLKYFHGGGGGGVVTRGVLDTNRQAVYLPDAEIVVNGHTHDQYAMPIRRERLTHGGRVKDDTIWFIRTGTYKDEYGDGSGGFAVEKKHNPKPIGAVWLRFAYHGGRDERCILVEPTLSVR